MIRLAFRPLIAVFAILSCAVAHAQEQEQTPVVVLTDTAEYCTHLERLIQDRPVRPPNVNQLLVEGRRMCEHGDVRRGIFRLRNALWILRHRTPAP